MENMLLRNGEVFGYLGWLLDCNMNCENMVNFKINGKVFISETRFSRCQCKQDIVFASSHNLITGTRSGIMVYPELQSRAFNEAKLKQ